MLAAGKGFPLALPNYSTQSLFGASKKSEPSMNLTQLWLQMKMQNRRKINQIS
jgi:hypothetical protein